MSQKKICLMALVPDQNFPGAIGTMNAMARLKTQRYTEGIVHKNREGGTLAPIGFDEQNVGAILGIHAKTPVHLVIATLLQKSVVHRIRNAPQGLKA
jgi:hypothetical protein